MGSGVGIPLDPGLFWRTGRSKKTGNIDPVSRLHWHGTVGCGSGQHSPSSTSPHPSVSFYLQYLRFKSPIPLTVSLFDRPVNQITRTKEVPPFTPSTVKVPVHHRDLSLFPVMSPTIPVMSSGLRLWIALGTRRGKSWRKGTFEVSEQMGPVPLEDRYTDPRKRERRTRRSYWRETH